MRAALVGLGALSAAALCLVALVTALDGLGIVYGALEGGLGGGMMMPPEQTEAALWGVARLLARLLEATGLVAVAAGIGLGLAGTRLRGIAGLAAAVAGVALGLGVLIGVVLGGGGLGDRFIDPWARYELGGMAGMEGLLRVGLLAHALPALALVVAGIALAVHAWGPRAVGVGAAGVAAAAMLLVPLRGVTTVGLFWLLSRRLWGEAVWAMPEGLVHLLQLLGDGLVGAAGAAAFVALALMLRPAPSDG